MPRRKASRRRTRSVPSFSVKAFLGASGTGRTVREYRRSESIFRQGDACGSVFYIQSGGVRLSVRSKTGREAVVGVLGAGDFFGEGCLAGQAVRTAGATAITPSVIRLVGKHKMVDLLQREHRMSDRFIAYLLSRNVRIEEDLTNEILSSAAQRGPT